MANLLAALSTPHTPLRDEDMAEAPQDEKGKGMYVTGPKPCLLRVRHFVEPWEDDFVLNRKKEKGMHVAGSEPCLLLVRHFVEPWEVDFVVNRKKELIRERISSDVVAIAFSTEEGAGRRIGHGLRVFVKTFDNVDGLFNFIIYATRIWCMDEVELYFVRRGDDGPFSPCNELESLSSILNCIKSSLSTAPDFEDILMRLDEKVREEIKSYVEEHSVDYLDEQQIEDYNDAYDELLRWGVAEGSKMTLRVADLPEGEKRFVASTEIDIGSTILSIPQTKLIDFEVYNDIEMKEILGKDAFVQKEILSLWCLKERFNKKSAFKLFFEKLPNKFNTGLSFGKEALAALEGTDLRVNLLSLQTSLKDQFEDLKPIFEKFSRLYQNGKFTFDEYLWAHELLYSNSLEVCFPGGRRELCLIPLLGFFSRSLFPHIIHCDAIGDDGNLNFVAVRPCLQGQLCYLSCGNLPGEDIAGFYGFLPKGNNHNDVINIDFYPRKWSGGEEPPVPCEWPYHMVRGSRTCRSDLPELLVSYLCAISRVDKKKLSDERNFERMVEPLLSYLLWLSDKLGSDDSRFMREDMTGYWDLKLALDYRELKRETVKSALRLVTFALADR